MSITQVDFFQSQDVARRNTAKLVFFFVLAVASLVILTNLLVMTVFGYLDTETLTFDVLMEQFDWRAFSLIGGGVITVIAVGSLYKIVALSGGGASLAESLGGELVVDGSGDLNKQKVLNVVEEIAIASGTPVPPVYLLEEDAINAFAAGFSPSDAVIGLTRGAVEKLSRAQLQGVVAHEFSHILNGDMRLNLRLIGVLNGILVIGMIGYFVLRSSYYSRHSTRRSSRDGNGGAIVVLGIGLMAIGYAGTFFGNLIKAAVSRQREYLADASAVQFTRNPTGIAGALKRIGGSGAGSLLENPQAAEISHALFSQGVTTFFASLFATHPPLGDRIRRIEPSWNGEYDLGEKVESKVDAQTEEKHERTRQEKTIEVAAAVLAGAQVISQVGQPGPEHLEYAQELINGIPETLSRVVREPHGARAVIYYLVLDNKGEMRGRQLQHLKVSADDGVYAETVKLVNEVEGLDVKYRLPLVDLALPALRQLSSRQYLLFKKNLTALIEMDDMVGLFEWVLQKIVFHHLDAIFAKRPFVKHTYGAFKQVEGACSVLLSLLVYTDKQEGISEEEVFNAAKEKLGALDIRLLARSEFSLVMLDKALDKLSQIHPLMKPQLLKACATGIAADKRVTPAEAELFRAISDVLDCPMPPLVVLT